MSALSWFRKAGEFVRLGFFFYISHGFICEVASLLTVLRSLLLREFLFYLVLAVISPCSSSGFASSPRSSGSSAGLVRLGFISSCCILSQLVLFALCPVHRAPAESSGAQSHGNQAVLAQGPLC